MTWFAGWLRITIWAIAFSIAASGKPSKKGAEAIDTLEELSRGLCQSSIGTLFGGVAGHADEKPNFRELGLKIIHLTEVIFQAK